MELHEKLNNLSLEIKLHERIKKLPLELIWNIMKYILNPQPTELLNEQAALRISPPLANRSRVLIPAGGSVSLGNWTNGAARHSDVVAVFEFPSVPTTFGIAMQTEGGGKQANLLLSDHFHLIYF